MVLSKSVFSSVRVFRTINKKLIRLPKPLSAPEFAVLFGFINTVCIEKIVIISYFDIVSVAVENPDGNACLHQKGIKVRPPSRFEECLLHIFKF